MKFTHAALAFVALSAVVSCLGPAALARPRIPRTQVPSDAPPDVREAIAALYSSDPMERAYAAEDLGAMAEGAIDAIPFLVSMLHDDTSLQWEFTSAPSGAIRYGREPTSPGREAARALASIGGECVDPLIVAYRHPNYVVRCNAVEALGSIDDSRALPPILDALADEHSVVRRKAVEMLSGNADPRAFPAILNALTDEDYWVRVQVVRALRSSSDPRAVEALIAAVGDVSSGIRIKAVQALSDRSQWGDGCDPGVQEALLAALRDEDPFVRARAARTLTKCNASSVIIEALISTLKDTVRNVQSAAGRSLSSLTDGGPSDGDYAAWREWWEQRKESPEKADN